MKLPSYTINLCFLVLVVPPAFGQSAKLKIDHLEKLAGKASEVTDVTLDGPLLQLASKFLSSEEADEEVVQDIIKGLKGVYVKSFEFDEEGAYSKADLEAVREQLRGPGWTRLINVTSKKEGNVEVYTLFNGDQIGGLAVLVTEDRELTIVNIVGKIDLAQLAGLKGILGIPPVPGIIPGADPKKP